MITREIKSSDISDAVQVLAVLSEKDHEYIPNWQARSEIGTKLKDLQPYATEVQDDRIEIIKEFAETDEDGELVPRTETVRTENEETGEFEEEEREVPNSFKFETDEDQEKAQEKLDELFESTIELSYRPIKKKYFKNSRLKGGEFAGIYFLIENDDYECDCDKNVKSDEGDN